MILEYCDGGELRWKDQFGEPALSLDETRKIFRDTLLGLAYREYAVALHDLTLSVHHQGIIHRDIKPSNLLFSGNGTVKISDFGCSHYSEALQAASAHAGPLPLSLDPKATSMWTISNSQRLQDLRPSSPRKCAIPDSSLNCLHAAHDLRTIPLCKNSRVLPFGHLLFRANSGKTRAAYTRRHQCRRADAPFPLCRPLATTRACLDGPITIALGLLRPCSANNDTLSQTPLTYGP
jgi:serine/threonine protein kinase